MATPFTTPRLITFDIFGTVVDWKTGLERACQAEGRPLGAGNFDRIIDAQGALEKLSLKTYADITQLSLQQVLGLSAPVAGKIAAGIGSWPLYRDSADSLQALLRITACAAMTNSDRVHGEQIQAQLGFKLSDWLCAEEAQIYKPNPKFWELISERQGISPGPHWWHVSAYADYDLAVASDLGLTSVFVTRPHNRPGPASYSVRDLRELVRKLEG